jgi:opacity protein-like surface antigen
MNRRYAGGVSALVVVLFIFAGAASAQLKITGGVKGGLNIMTPYGDDLKILEPVLNYAVSGGDQFTIDVPGDGDEYNIDLNDSTSIELGGLGTKMGFLISGYLCFQLNEYFAIQPEVTYIRKGGKQDVTVNSTLLSIPIPISGSVMWKLDYIEIPILAKIILPTKGKISPNLIIGPAVAFNVGSKIGGELLGAEADFDIDPIISSTDFGMIVGAGVDYDISEKAMINLEGRFGLGFTNWFDLPLDIVSVKNGNISIMAGFGYRFGS